MSVTPNKILIDLRHKKGESQAQAAKNIGISQSMLAMLETGYRKGSDGTKIKIANYYDKSVDTIFLQLIVTFSDKEVIKCNNYLILTGSKSAQ